MAETPPPRTSDMLEPPHRQRVLAEATPARAALLSFLAAAYGGGEDAEAEHERELERLREEPAAVMAETAQALGAAHPHDFPTRFALIHAAVQLRHASSLALLASVATTPIPPEPGEHSHSFSLTANETILRTTAVEGLGELARDGEREARDVLFHCLRNPSLSVRRAAVQAILAGGRTKSMVARVQAALAPEDHFLIGLARPKVRDIPQVEDPERFLSDEARVRKADQPPDPLAPQESPTSEAPER